MIGRLLVIAGLLASGLSAQTTVIGGASGGSGTSAGSANAVQSGDGSGGFRDSGCTATGGVGTCANGFVAGTSFRASGAEIAAPTVNSPTVYFDSTLHLPQFKNASNVMVGSMIVPLSDPGTDHNWIKFIPSTGTPTRTRPACADLSDSGTACTATIASYALLAGPTFTGVPAAPTAAADTNTTQLATTAFYAGQAGSTTPVVEGTGAAGTSLKFARADHVHPKSTITLPYGCAVGDPAGSALATGVLCYVTVPTAGTITGWDIIVDAGTATVDVLKIATGTAKPTSSIAASALPAISTGTAIHSTTLTSWTTAVSANDMIGFNLTTVATAKYITVNVQVAH